MTVAEMIEEVHDNLGKPSDLDPYTASVVDVSTTGGARLLDWINRAYKQILFWKLRNGTHIRFDCTRAKMYFQSNVTSGTAQSGASSTITLASGEVPANDAFNGWLIKTTGGTGSGQERIIIDSSSATDVCTVHKAWTTTPDATTTYEIYHHAYKVLASTDAEASLNIGLNPVSEFFAPESIVDLNNGSHIPLSSNERPMAQNRDSYGTPGVFFWDQESIIFDVAPDETISYELEYVRIPSDMTATTDEPEIPEIWHDAIVMWATHRGLRRQQESGDAWAVKNDLIDLIESLVQQREMKFDKQEGYLEVG